MEETGATPAQPVQPQPTIQEVQTGLIHLQEGYQPLPIERKGYQPREVATPSTPPQSVSAAIPFAATSLSDGNTAAQATQVASVQPQGTSTGTTEAAQQQEK